MRYRVGIRPMTYAGVDYGPGELLPDIPADSAYAWCIAGMIEPVPPFLGRKRRAPVVAFTVGNVPAA